LSRQVWKWIYEMMSDEDLVGLANAARVKVPGFRNVTVEQSRILRPRLIQSMSTGKDLTRVKQAMDDHATECERCSSYRHKTQPELLQDIDSGDNPIKVLTSLLTSADSGKQMLAELLFETLQSSGRLADMTNKVAEVRREIDLHEAIHSNLMKQNDEQSKMIKKYEERIGKLEKAEAIFNETKAQLDEKIKQLHANLEEQLEQMEEERARWEEERAGLLSQLAEKQALLDQKSWVASAVVEVAADTEASDGLSAESGQASKTPVVLVGKSPTVASANYEIKTVEVHQVEQAFEQNLFQEADQVWVLTYEAPLGTQRKLRRGVERERLREFHTLKELQRHIGSVSNV